MEMTKAGRFENTLKVQFLLYISSYGASTNGNGRRASKGYALGRLGLFEPGGSVGHVATPQGIMGMVTVCSIMLNGVLLKYGIPTCSRVRGPAIAVGQEADQVRRDHHVRGDEHRPARGIHPP